MTPKRSSSFVPINGRPLFVDVDGSGPAMIMVHGLGGSSNYFQPLLTAFSSSYTIIRFDWEGLGRSKLDLASTDKITIPKYVKDLKAIMAHFDLESAVIIGHSLGSVVAMHFATEFPDKVSGLVLIGPGRTRANVPAAKAFTLGMARTARELGMPAMADGTVAKNVAPSSSDVVRAFVREVIAGQDGEGYARVCEAACDDSHVDPDYSLIVCPTVIIAGDQDLISSSETAKQLQGLIGGNERSVGLEVVHAGHQQVLEDTDAVIRAIKTIL
jgi:3-oxoadipate enol-lactonase